MWWCVVIIICGIASRNVGTRSTTPTMDSELEELESLFSEHFGRTPVSTPAASQEIDDYSSDSDDDRDLEGAATVDIDYRAQRYVEEMVRPECDSRSSEDEVEIELNRDDPDICRIRDFQENGCGCKTKCVSQFSEQALYSHMLDMREMTKDEKDVFIMGVLNAETTSETTKRGKKRQRMRQSLTFNGHAVCKKTFLLVHDIGKYPLKKIIEHMQTKGIAPRQHGNVGKKPAHALNFDDVKRTIQFISNYGDEHGLPQPAAPRGRDDIPPVYLCSSMTKKTMHDLYVASCGVDDQLRAVKYSTFCNIWNHSLPHIKIAKPRDDVCAICEKMRKKIMDSVTEEEKLESTMAMQQHIHRAQKERTFYNDCIKTAKETSDLTEKFVHYTFDFSQNVTIPHHAHQMGPLYFLSLRKIQLFGFRVDGDPKQLNFLIDEDQTIGQDGKSTHGPDAVISMVDWALQNHSKGETECTIHADNCGGQNKNQFVLGYLMWRVLTGQHEKITYSMQIPGHSRCLIDGGFGMIKKLYRRTDCDDIGELEAVVNNSSKTNTAVIYPAWQWRSWKTFLVNHFKPLPGIRKYQHFVFDRSEHGIITVKESADSTESKINILKQRDVQFNAMDRPRVILPEGMSVARSNYLYTAVRPYVRPGHEDSTCPNPN